MCEWRLAEGRGGAAMARPSDRRVPTTEGDVPAAPDHPDLHCSSTNGVREPDDNSGERHTRR